MAESSKRRLFPFTLYQKKGRREDIKPGGYNYLFRVANVKDLEAAIEWQYSPCKLKDGYRLDDNFISSDVVVMDIDNKTLNKDEFVTVDDVQKRFPDVCFAYETSRHHRKSKGGDGKPEYPPAPRYHILFPLGKEITDIEAYKTIKKAIYDTWPAVFDKDDLAATQGKFVSATPQCFFMDGTKTILEWLEENRSPAPDPKRKETKRAPERIPDNDSKRKSKYIFNEEFFRYCLEKLDPQEHSDYNEWIKVAMALKHEGMDFQLFDDWSKGDPEKYNAKAALETWNSIDRRPREKPITGAFLVRLAKESCSDFDQGLPDSCRNLANTGLTVSGGLSAVRKMLTYDKNGETVLNTFPNALAILEYDPNLPIIRKNLLSSQIECIPRNENGIPWLSGQDNSLLWNSGHDTGLDEYCCKVYGVDFSARNHERAIIRIAAKNSYDPVKEYLESLPEWDGIGRAETVFCDFLGAEDSAYTRGVTRYALSACVQRIYNPGVKWDNMVILIGDQGGGKSTLLAKLARFPEFFTDGLKISMMGDQKGYEQVKSSWIVEVGEMAGLRKAEDEAVKQFLSSGCDKYREPYAKQETDHPRRCVIFGTTNIRDGILRDPTGGRRYYPIRLPRIAQTEKRGWFITPDRVDQIWAEVLAKWKKLDLQLPPELESTARKLQANETFEDPAVGDIEAFLDLTIPDEWDSMPISSRRAYFLYVLNGCSHLGIQEDIPESNLADLHRWRDTAHRKIEKTCLLEIWTVALGRKWESRNSTEARNLMRHIKGWESQGPAKRENILGRKQVVYKRV